MDAVRRSDAPSSGPTDCPLTLNVRTVALRAEPDEPLIVSSDVPMTGLALCPSHWSGERDRLHHASFSVQTHESSHVLNWWANENEGAECASVVRRHPRQSRSRHVGTVTLLVTLCAHGVDPGRDKAVQVVVSTPWRQSTPEPDLGGVRYVESGPAFTLTSVHEERQVVPPTFALRSVLQRPSVSIRSCAFSCYNFPLLTHTRRLAVAGWQLNRA